MDKFFKRILRILLWASPILLLLFFLMELSIVPHTANTNHLKLANIYSRSAADLDPSSIRTIEQYHLLRNLYDRLLAYDSHGEVIAGIPESFRWENDSLIFEFGARVRTIDGYPIIAEDAARSLKRAIMLKGTGHGDIRSFLCPDAELKTMDDDCRGIKFENNILTLTPVKKNFGPHLMAMLGSADFSIIPRVALSKDPSNPAIIDHRNTSGPYFVEKDDSTGAWTLRANPNSYLFNKEMPTTIQLVHVEPTKGEDLKSALDSGKIDMIPTPIFFSGESAEKMLNARDSYSVHESMPIKVILICFNRSAKADFSAAQRLFAAQQIEKFLNFNSPVPGMKPTVEFFQSLSDGSLTDSQRAELTQLRSKISRPQFTKPIKVGSTGKTFERMKTFLADYPEIEVVDTGIPSYQLPVNERPDIYIASNDSAWTESISLLEYNFRAGIFHLEGVDGNEWVQDYIATDDHNLRMGKLQKLHFELLKSLTLYPVTVSPYYAVSNKNWKLPFSTFSAGTELWKIRPAGSSMILADRFR